MNPRRSSVPAWTYAITAMFAVQICSALSTHITGDVGAVGVAWLRMSFAALIMIAFAPPPVRTLTRSDVLPLLGFGATTALMTTSFLLAIDRIPLGTAVAIEFLGPLTIAAVQNRSLQGWLWTALACCGVVLLNKPWQGEVNGAGVGFALLAALGWALYILFTQAAGDRFEGVSSLSLILPIAALLTTFMGAPPVVENFSWRVIGIAIILAALNPALTFALEMTALKRMKAGAYGVLAALEPGIGALIGMTLLHEKLDYVQLLGLVCVLLAGVGSQKGAKR